MEDAFKTLQSQGQNNVDNLIKWMKEAKVVDNTKEAEDKARSLFNDVENKQAVEYNSFKQVLDKLASENNKSVDDFSSKLSKLPTTMQNLFSNATNALSSAMK